MFHDKDNDNGPSRTISLSEKDVRAARRLLALLLGINETSHLALVAEPSPSLDASLSRESLVALAREDFARRARRVALFGSAMFGEPAWEMLIALYVLDTSGQRQTIGTLLQFSSTSPSTAKRWLDYLAVHNLIIRDEHPTDRRTAFIRLSPIGREKLDMYYSGTKNAGA